MGPVTHQTIKLSNGKHESPAEGACAMELASMLAGEPFSDHPMAVCPVIGSLLRAYNDSLDDERRQDLYVYAAKIVGSAGSEELERARIDHLNAWISEREPHRWARFFIPRRLRALAFAPPIHVAGSHAIRTIAVHDDQTHSEVLALLDELLMLGCNKRSLLGADLATTSSPSAPAAAGALTG